jgi:phosphatidylserine synthase
MCVASWSSRYDQGSNASRVNFANLVPLFYVSCTVKVKFTGVYKTLKFLADGADGPVARALKGTRFGAELDSLSDYVNFGVSPALLLFYWCFQSWGVQGWCISLLFIICMACRLARFNAGNISYRLYM